LDFVDNLRSAIIILVVSMHAAVTYSHVGSWYFMEDPKPGPLVLGVFATYQVFLQAFFMGLLFFLAGYFVPAAFDRKGAQGFIRERVVRLGVPSLFFMLVVQPFTVYWLLRTFAKPGIPSLARAYLPYIVSGRFLEGSGPMWFAVALLMFSLVYTGVRLLRRREPIAQAEPTLPRHWQVVGLALLMGACTFLVRTVQPLGTSLLNMQLCFFSQYVFLFCVGIHARRHDWLRRLPCSFGLCWFRVASTVGVVCWFALVVPLLKTHTEDKLVGGWTWQSAAFSFWESFFCLGVSLGLLVLFREKLNSRGRVQRFLSENSFAVYMFHTPLLIAVTLLMRDFQAPKLIKFVIATLLGVAISYAASSFFFRRVPLLKRVL
jgi:fucose 4-O-acetylase-like acetyltransferase